MCKQLQEFFIKALFFQDILESRCSGLDDYEKPRTCLDLLCRGSKLSGVYQVYPDGTDVYSFDVYCDMKTDGGGWTVRFIELNLEHTLIENNKFRSIKDPIKQII